MSLTIDAVYLGTILSVILAAMAGYGVLLVVIWQSINHRLRSLGHEDRDIRNQIHGVLETLESHHKGTLEAVMKSNALMANVYSRVLPTDSDLDKRYPRFFSKEDEGQ